MTASRLRVAIGAVKRRIREASAEGELPHKPFIGSALNPVNISLIATALLPIGQNAALVTALYLATAIAQPTAGKAAEVPGPRRVFLAGIIMAGVAPGWTGHHEIRQNLGRFRLTDQLSVL